MVYADLDGLEMVKALRKHDYRLVDRTGSHVKLRYTDPNTGDVRNVTVPLKDGDRISQGTYRSIADQCGADDFKAWCDRIDAVVRHDVRIVRPKPVTSPAKISTVTVDR